MKTLGPLVLMGLIAACHLDKLLNAGGGASHVSNAPPARLVFSSLPRGAQAGRAMGPVRVSIVDSAGTPVALVDTYTVSVTLASPGGVTLHGNTLQHPVRGIAIFSDLSVDRATTGYALTAASDGLGLPAVTSDTFSVDPGPVALLVFTVEPKDAILGNPITPPVEVTASDAVQNKATNFTGEIRLAVASDAGASLSGNVASAVAGVATFPDLRVNRVGGYTLTAAIGDASPLATSAGFQVTPVPPAPGTLTVTTATTGPSLPSGYTLTLDAETAQPIGINVSNATFGGILAGSHQLTLGGVPANCSVGEGNPQTVNVPAGGSTHATFTVTCVGPAQPPSPLPPPTGPHLVVTGQPAITQAGHLIRIVRVTAYDASGNQNTSFNGTITLSMGFNPVGGTLTGGGPSTAANGVAQWEDLVIDTPGNGYTLHATASGMTETFSDPLDITAGAPPAPNGADGLGFYDPPTTTRAGAVMAPVRVAALSSGPVATGYNGPIWVSLVANNNGGTLTGTRRLVAVNGFVTYTDLRIDKPGHYQLRVTAWPLNYMHSIGFDITP